MAGRIAGLNAPGRTDLAVLKPFLPTTIGPDPMLLTRWLAGLPAWTPLALIIIAVPGRRLLKRSHAMDMARQRSRCGDGCRS